MSRQMADNTLSNDPPPLPGRGVAGRTLPPKFIANQFKRGTSGNPSGSRGAKYGEVVTMARQFSCAAVERLVALMGSDDERVALLAAQAILDRAFGKPAAPAVLESEARMPVNSEARERVFALLVRGLELKVREGRAGT